MVKKNARLTLKKMFCVCVCVTGAGEGGRGAENEHPLPALMTCVFM